MHLKWGYIAIYMKNLVFSSRSVNFVYCEFQVGNQCNPQPQTKIVVENNELSKKKLYECGRKVRPYTSYSFFG